MITNEQWETVESELKGLFGVVNFKLDDKKITITKEFIAENKMAYIVYIDGSVTLGWGSPSSELYDPTVEKVWHKKTRSIYKPREIKRLIKDWGKREAKRMFPNLEEKQVYFNPYFEKYSVLHRQFKKIKELELWVEEEK